MIYEKQHLSIIESYIKKYNNIHNKNVVKSKKFILHFKNLKWYNKYTACSFDNVSPVVKATFFIINQKLFF